MIHTLDLDKGLEVIRNGLRPGVGDDARLTTRKGFQGALHNDHHIPFGHLLANPMVDNVAAVAVQDAAQAVLSLAHTPAPPPQAPTACGDLSRALIFIPPNLGEGSFVPDMGYPQNLSHL
jgi:hypothetical protein